MINPWKILGVHRKSSDEEVRDNYLAMAKLYHPDKIKVGARGSDAAYNTFLLATKSYNMIKNKVVRNVNIGHLKVECDDCTKCWGAGVTTRSRGLTGKEYTACKGCGGSGFIIEENEDEQRIIELRGTDGAGGKGRHKKRGHRHDQCI